VKAGFSLQLGLLGVLAELGGFDGLGPSPRAGDFEYWSLAKKGDQFGYRDQPVDPMGKRDKIVTDEFTAHAHAHFETLANDYLLGNAPFVAQLNPELANYGDYDQLMRLEEWYGRDDG